MEKNRNTLYIARLSLLMITAVWGGGFVVTKNALEVLSPDFITLFRFIVASVIFGFAFRKHFKNLKRSTLVKGSLIGFFCWLSLFLQTIGQQYTDSSKSAFLTSVYCVLTPFVCWLLTKKKPAAYNFVAGVICLAGVGLVSLNGELCAVNVGDMLTLLCGVALAFQIALIGMCKGEDMSMISFVQMAVSALLALISYIARDGSVTQAGESLGIAAMAGAIYLALLSTTICYGIQNWAQKYVPASEASLLMCFESLFGVIFSIIFCGDEMTMKLVAGFALIFAAVLISEVDIVDFLKKKWQKNQKADA